MYHLLAVQPRFQSVEQATYSGRNRNSLIELPGSVISVRDKGDVKVYS